VTDIQLDGARGGDRLRMWPSMVRLGERTEAAIKTKKPFWGAKVLELTPRRRGGRLTTAIPIDRTTPALPSCPMHSEI